jgi:hypothetical protein
MDVDVARSFLARRVVVMAPSYMVDFTAVRAVGDGLMDPLTGSLRLEGLFL